MKVQYLGDVNDYRKYALLRILAGTGLRLGINWLLTPDDGREDGRKRRYLAQADRWRAYDPDLFDMLTQISPTPTLSEFQQIERNGTIPSAVCFDRVVPAGPAARKQFHAASMEFFAACDLVFFDPDNGLSIASISKAHAAAVKFVFDDELGEHYRAGRSLFIYQHFPRVERLCFIRVLEARLRGFAPNATIWACHTSHVAFMLVANPTHRVAISIAVEIGGSRWPETFIKFEQARAG